MSETKQKHMETFGQSLTVRYDTCPCLYDPGCSI